MRIPYFNDAEITVHDIDPPIAEAEVAAVLAAFRSLTTADRLSDSRHCHAYYQDIREWIGAESWMDEEMGVPSVPEAIWEYITPASISVYLGHDGDDHLYVAMEAECGWEAEHGLMMVWRDGRTLCKVGAYDGHLTNMDSGEGGPPQDVVYDGLDKKYRTYRNR